MIIFLIIVILFFVVDLLLFISIIPVVGRRKEWQNLRIDTQYFAHRGLFNNEADAPENSLKAFAKAIDGGFGIELDVQLTKDKVPVVFHDATLLRMCGVDRKLADCTYEELRQFKLLNSEERIPLFTEVLELVDSRAELLIELKNVDKVGEYGCIVDGVLKQYEGPYIIESFNPLAVRWYKKNRPEVIRGQLSGELIKACEGRGILYFMLSNLMFNFLAKPDFISYDVRYAGNIPRIICRYVFGNTAAGWTIRSEESLAKAKEQFDIYIFEGFIPEKQ